MHWADAFVQDLAGHQTVSTGISPSGPIHVGNMREILTGNFIYVASRDRGLETRFIYLCDDMDPLRKVYPFLDRSYSSYVGQPLYKIPAPQGEGTYSEYFLRPFLDTLDTINVRVEVIRTSNLYREGKFAEAIDVVMKNSQQIRRILEEISGRDLEENWSPYNPICESCGRINTTSITSYRFPYVEYSCRCGHSGQSDVRKDQGKLPWRIEWPAKWKILGVTVEPFGKDHGAPGGSYDTGKAIAEKIFGISAPKPMIYERILLKGKGAMHSSTGIAIPASEMIRVAPPQILRFLIARSQPGRHIDFDPGLGLLNLIDEYERYRDIYFGLEASDDNDAKRIYELSRVREEKPGDVVSFRHLITLIQIYHDDSGLLSALKRGGYTHDSISGDLRAEMEIARSWLDTYGPDQMKFTLLPTDAPVELGQAEKAVIKEFLQTGQSVNWDAESIHNRIHEILRSGNMDPKEGFSIFYRVLIGKTRGPRLGYFLSNLDRDWVMERLKRAVS